MEAIRNLLIAVVVIGVAWPVAADRPLVVVDRVCDVDSSICSGGVQGLRGARSVAVSPDGAHVYVASSLDDALVVFGRDAGSGVLAHVQSVFDTDAGVDGLDSARGVAVSPDGEHVYVAALLDSSLAVFDRDVATGVVSFVEVERDGSGGVDGLGGAHGVALSPGGEHVYVASRSDNAVAVFSRNATTGAVTFVDAEFNGMGGVSGLGGAEAVVVSPDGEHVYVAAETADAVVVFDRDSNPGSGTFGRLTFVEAQYDGVGMVDGLAGAGGLALDSGGNHLYVGCERGSIGGIAGDDWVAVFSRNSSTGQLTFVESLDESQFGDAVSGIFAYCTGVGNENSGITVSADDSSVFVTNPYFGTVAAFTRNPVTGSLDLAASVCDRNYGADGLAGAVGITVSPDGRLIYTASSGFEAVAGLTQAVFADGFESGSLTQW